MKPLLKFIGRYPRRLYQAGLLSVFVVGLAVGNWQYATNHRVLDDPGSIKRFRSGEGKYTNPLLACDTDSNQDLTIFENLKTELETITNQAESNKIEVASIYFRDFMSGESFIINPSQRYIPASLNKVPLMIKVFEKAQSDPKFLQTKIINNNLTDANQLQQVRPTNSMKSFVAYTLEDAVKLMIIHSDNNAYDSITKLIKYDDYLRLFNVLKIPVEENNGVLVNEYAYFLRMLYNATVLNHEMSEKALSLLTQVEYKNGLREGVPDSIEIAHKFGTSGYKKNDKFVEHQLHDCGIVYLPNRPYLLCVMTKGDGELADIESYISEISQKTFQHLSSLL